MRKKYKLLDKASIPRGSGGIICMCAEPVPIDETDAFISYNLIREVFIALHFYEGQ